MGLAKSEVGSRAIIEGQSVKPPLRQDCAPVSAVSLWTAFS